MHPEGQPLGLDGTILEGGGYASQLVRQVTRVAAVVDMQAHLVAHRASVQQSQVQYRAEVAADL